jgi:hypothetical protein
MNGQEKSDSAIVAERPTNGAGKPAEEPAEPRAGAEGKAIQQGAFRAQNRADASQALERLRRDGTLHRHLPEAGAVCGVREESWNELASESLVRSTPSRQDGSESCGRRGNAGSEA